MPGRFHVPGEFGAGYLALDPDTALRELAQRAARTAVPVESLLPRDLLTVHLRLTSVLDLTEAAVRAEWGLDAAALQSDDYTACQEVAAAARRAGYEGIRYPSATGQGENVALFFDRLHPGSFARVEDRSSIHPKSAPGA